MAKSIPQSHVRALMSEDTSRLNKIHLATGWRKKTSDTKRGGEGG